MENIDDIQLGLVKFRANAEKYFSLFDKHIPRFENSGKDQKFLLLGICNESVMLKICALNPKAKYYIADQEILSETLPLLDKNLDFKFYDSNLDLYDIIKGIDMKFDCIIMNPPYDGQLHLKIFEEASKHLSKDGVCVSLSPTPWLAKFNVNRPMAKYRKVFNGKIKHIEVIEHATANAMFDTGNAIEELGIYVVKNDDSAPIDLMKYGFNNDAEKSLYNKINMMNPKAGVITYNKAALDIRYGSVSAKTAYCNKGCTNIDIRKPFDVPIYTWHGGKTCKEAVLMLKSKKKVSMVLYFNSQVEHDNFINSLDTTFMNWYYQMFVVPGDCKIINYMFRMVDYSQPWTDERFYKFFNITPEEQKVIEETMEKYK